MYVTNTTGPLDQLRTIEKSVFIWIRLLLIMPTFLPSLHIHILSILMCDQSDFDIYLMVHHAMTQCMHDIYQQVKLLDRSTCICTAEQ